MPLESERARGGEAIARASGGRVDGHAAAGNGNRRIRNDRASWTVPVTLAGVPAAAPLAVMRVSWTRQQGNHDDSLTSSAGQGLTGATYATSAMRATQGEPRQGIKVSLRPRRRELPPRH